MFISWFTSTTSPCIQSIIQQTFQILDFLLFSQVFELCCHENSNEVHYDDLINFIELVAELEGGEDAVDPVAAQIAACKIMGTYDETTHQHHSPTKRINEEEFIKKLTEFVFFVKLWFANEI